MNREFAGTNLAYFNWEGLPQFKKEILPHIVSKKDNITEEQIQKMFMEFVYSKYTTDENDEVVVLYKEKIFPIKRKDKGNFNLSERFDGLVENAEIKNVLDTNYTEFRQSPMMNKIYRFLKNNDIINTISPDLDIEVGVQGVAFRDIKDGRIMIAFRGTTAHHRKRDFVQDLLMGVGLKSPRFFKEAKTFSTNIILNNPDTKMTFVGHSLGGSLAQYCHHALKYMIKDSTTATFNAYNIIRLLRQEKIESDLEGTINYRMTNLEGKYEALSEIGLGERGDSSNNKDLITFKESFDVMGQHERGEILYSNLVYNKMLKILGETQHYKVNQLIRDVGPSKILDLLYYMKENNIRYVKDVLEAQKYLEMSVERGFDKNMKYIFDMKVKSGEESNDIISKAKRKGKSALVKLVKHGAVTAITYIKPLAYGIRKYNEHKDDVDKKEKRASKILDNLMKS